MSSERLVGVPGAERSIKLPMKRVDLAAVTGEAGHSVEFPAPLPIQFREIVKPSPVSAHWLLDTFGPRIAPDGFVFLGRAIREVGSALIGGEWTGHEFGVNFSLQPLPDRDPTDFDSKSVSREDKFAALGLLEKGHPPRKFGWDTMADRQWKKAQAMREEAIDYVRPARIRARAVLEAFERAFAAGTLVARLQPTEGGNLIAGERPATEWLAPYTTLFRRLVTCRMDPRSPMDPKGSSHWIYVSRTGLTRMLSDHRKRDAEAAEADKPKTTAAHRKPFMARVRDAVQARPDGPSERDSLIAEGRAIYRLPAKVAEQAFKEAVDTAGVPHDWSKPGRRGR